MQTIKSIYRSLALAMLLAIPGYPIFAQQTVSPTVDIDASILYNTRPGYESNATTNYGAQTTIFAQAGTNGSYNHFWRSLIGLNLSSIPTGATINSATLTLYGSGGHQNTTLNGSPYLSNACWLRRTTQAWTETGVTWSNQPTVTTTNQVGLASSTSISQNYTADITQLVKDMISNPTQGNGLLLILQSETKYCTMTFFSSDYTDVTKRPVVSITYTVAGMPYTLSLSPSTNYIRIITPEAKMATVPGVSATHDATTINEDIQYFDGLGRPAQTVSVDGSPTGNDIITPIAYDSYGRETDKYLPYTQANNNGALVASSSAITAQQTFYSTLYTGEGSNAKSHIVYEPSPLNRVLETGAPGSTWQPADETGSSTGHTNKVVYATNTSPDVLLLGLDLSGNLVNTGGDVVGGKSYYQAGQLYKTVAKDENWTSTSGTVHTTEEFKDKQGRVVMKRTYQDASTKMETYYVYDDLGLLHYVISPKAVGLLSFPLSGSSTLIRQLCYYYRYDSRNRMAVKQLPGADSVYMVYDNRDRLVLTQDGERRKSNQWLFIKYDELNRPAVTGLLTYGTVQSQIQMQAIVNGVYPTRSYYIARNNTGTTGYAEGSFPTTGDGTLTYLTATWYDSYGFPNALGFDTNNNISGYSDSEGASSYYFERLLNKVTGTAVNVLGTSTWVTTSNYYDSKYREVQARRTLFDGTLASPSANGSETLSNQFDFVGKVMKSRQIQTFNGSITTFGKRFQYDQADRLVLIKQMVGTNSNDSVVISQVVYNELGQLLTKKLHIVTSGSPVQTMDYAYNIRGWLTQINDPESLGSDKFGMKLFYNTTETGLNTQQFYNGNISAIKWDDYGQSKQGYEYSYDALNRLTIGNYKTYSGTTWIVGNSPYYEAVGSYDANGNIVSLLRKDASGNNSFNGTYSYTNSQSQTGNQLQSITNAVDSKTYSYTYDANGNTTLDGLRGFTISYNLLNLPSSVSLGTNILSYIYSATGEKLAKVKNGSVVQYYCGNMIYNNAKVLDYLLHEEGMVKNISGSFTYEYFLRDHLGDTRAVVNSNGGVEQSTDYYPFGLAFQNNNLGINKYLYNGKEIQDETLGTTFFGEYDYGARFYDPQIGRFHTQDPHAEDYEDISPYVYVENNPLSNTDPDGMDVIDNGNSITINGNDVLTYWGYLQEMATGGYSEAQKNVMWTNFQAGLKNASGKNNGKGGPLNSTLDATTVESERTYDPNASKNYSLYTPEETNKACMFMLGIAGGEIAGAFIGVGAEAYNAYRAAKAVNTVVKVAETAAKTEEVIATGTEIVAANGTKIKGLVGHAVNRAIQRGVKPQAILDALKNPLKIGKVVVDNLGRQSQRLIGRYAEVVVNPETGNIISVNPTSTAKAAKLLK